MKRNNRHVRPLGNQSSPCPPFRVWQTEDLPLFSGTAQPAANDAPFTVATIEERAPQLPLPLDPHVRPLGFDHWRAASLDELHAESRRLGDAYESAKANRPAMAPYSPEASAHDKHLDQLAAAYQRLAAFAMARRLRESAAVIPTANVGITSTPIHTTISLPATPSAQANSSEETATAEALRSIIRDRRELYRDKVNNPPNLRDYYPDTARFEAATARHKAELDTMWGDVERLGALQAAKVLEERKTAATAR
jgi:hypothetical protein